MKYLCAHIFFLVAFTSSMPAQILQVDKSHLNSDSAGYFVCTSDLNFALDSRSVTPSENLIYTRLTSRTDLLYVSKKKAYILVNSIDYFKSGNSQPFSTGYGHLRINFRRKHKISFETFAQIQYDEIRRMRLRQLVGAGVRLTVVDKDLVDVHMGSGVMYEIEKWREVEGDPATDFKKWMPKSSSYIGIEFILSNSSQLTIWGMHQVGYDSQDDLVRTRYAGEATLNFHISRRMTWTTRCSYFYDVQPVIAIRNSYFQLTNGLQIKF